MNSCLIDTADPRWQFVLEKSRHDFYHLPAYVELEANRIDGEAAAFFAEEAGFFFFLPMIVRPLKVNDMPLAGYENAKDAVSPYGYPCPLICAPTEKNNEIEFIGAALESFKNKMKELLMCSVFVSMHPLMNRYNDELASIGSLNQHGQTVWIDLSSSEEEMRRQTRSRYRTHIANLKRNGFAAELDTTFQHLEKFVELYHLTMENVNAAGWYFFGIDYFRKLKDALGSGLKLCVVKDGDSIASAGLFTESCGIVQYHLAGRDPNARSQDTVKLLFDFMRLWGKERGNEQFHLGGGFGSQSDNLFFFKSGFSKMRATFCSWRLIFDSDIYNAAISKWESLAGAPADDVNGYFPAYRKDVGGI